MRIKKMKYFILSVPIVLIAAVTIAWSWDKGDGAYPKHYIEALYEQVFNEGFEIPGQGYRDEYYVRWCGEKLTTRLINEDYIDGGSALEVSNETNSSQELSIVFDDFLKSGKVKIPAMRISFYARKVSEAPELDITVEVDGASTAYREKLEHKWSCYNNIVVDISEATQSMKMTIDVKPGQQFKLDEFLIVGS